MFSLVALPEGVTSVDIQYLKTVLLAATHLNFSKVAEEIPCAQSSVSRQVKCVEDTLGITLFERPVRGERLKLTEQGTSVLPLIEQVVEHYDSLEFYVHRLKSQLREPYVIGLPLGRISIKTECQLLEQIYLFAPGHDIQFQFYQSGCLIEHLRKREFDAMLVSRVFWIEDRYKTPEFATVPSLHITPLCYRPPCIAMRADHPCADQNDVDIGELRDCTFAQHYNMIQDGARAGDIATLGFFRHCKRAGFIPKMEIISKNFSELRNVCVENYNWLYPTFQMDWMLPSDRVRAVPLRDPLYSSEYYLVNYKDRTDDTSSIIQSFFQHFFQKSSSQTT